MMDDCPAIEYRPAPCPRCGAVTADEAAMKCQPAQTEDGEYYCPADDAPDIEDGRLQQPTKESVDRWCDFQVKASGV